MHLSISLTIEKLEESTEDEGSEIVNWSISDETKAEIVQNGEYALVNGKSLGSVTVKAEKNGKIGELEINVVEKAISDLDAIIISGSQNIEVGKSVQFEAKGLFSDKSEKTINP